jgi:adenosylcobinamide kinase / adenosylcobinamide-phosphate guanylyltransferase
MSRLVFILGGARSGKSEHAQRLAEASKGDVVFIATAQALDDEMKERIEAHRLRRPKHWQTLELTSGVGEHMKGYASSGGVVLLDCITLLISNILWRTERQANPVKAAHEAVQQEIRGLTAAIKGSAAEWIVVSNEVGQGIVPAYPSGRIFRDLLGWANKMLAQQADEVIWMVAGIPVPITEHRLQPRTK